MELTREQILGAIGRAWCVKPNTGKVVDVDLGNAIADKIMALRAVDQGAPAAWRYVSAGDEGTHCYEYREERDKETPYLSHETPLYTRPADPALAERLLREVMETHADPVSSDYNECDKSRCQWCEDAAFALGGGK